MEDRLLKIINHYGVMHQLKKFQEEIFELNEAIIDAEKYSSVNDDFSKVNINVKAYKDHITEEIADVTVMLEQFQKYYDISNFEIYEVMEKKVERQLNRIKNGD